MDELLRRIEATGLAAAAEGRELVPVGPFRMLFDPRSDVFYLNYAVPAEPLATGTGLGEALDVLERAFAERGRRLRFEFTAELWPELGPALAARGVECEGSYPKMSVCPGGLLAVDAPGVEVRLLSGGEPDALLRELLVVRDEAFGSAGESPGSALAQLRAAIGAAGWRVAIGLLDGVVVGTGVTLAAEGIAELAGVGTAAAARRRGVAATLSSRLVEEVFASGGSLVWLSAGDRTAEAVYAKIGFRPFATHVAWSRPAAAGP